MILKNTQFLELQQRIKDLEGEVEEMQDIFNGLEGPVPFKDGFSVGFNMFLIKRHIRYLNECLTDIENDNLNSTKNNV